MNKRFQVPLHIGVAIVAIVIVFVIVISISSISNSAINILISWQIFRKFDLNWLKVIETIDTEHDMVYGTWLILHWNLVERTIQIKNQTVVSQKFTHTFHKRAYITKLYSFNSIFRWQSFNRFYVQISGKAECIYCAWQC